jgi:hypothetical protein
MRAQTVIMVRKILFAAISTMMEPLGADLQAFAGMLVLIIALVIQIKLEPFTRPGLNLAEVLGLMTNGMTLYLGLVIQSPNTGNTASVLLAWVILLMNCVFLFYVLWHLVKATKKYIPPPQEAKRIISKHISNLNDQLGSFRGSFRTSSRDSWSDADDSPGSKRIKSKKSNNLRELSSFDLSEPPKRMKDKKQILKKLRRPSSAPDILKLAEAGLREEYPTMPTPIGGTADGSSVNPIFNRENASPLTALSQLSSGESNTTSTKKKRNSASTAVVADINAELM